jgi:hypothetical protein
MTTSHTIVAPDSATVTPTADLIAFAQRREQAGRRTLFVRAYEWCARVGPRLSDADFPTQLHTYFPGLTATDYAALRERRSSAMTSCAA